MRQQNNNKMNNFTPWDPKAGIFSYIFFTQAAIFSPNLVKLLTKKSKSIYPVDLPLNTTFFPNITTIPLINKKWDKYSLKNVLNNHYNNSTVIDPQQNLLTGNFFKECILCPEIKGKIHGTAGLKTEIISLPTVRRFS